MKQVWKNYLKFEDHAKIDDAYTSLRGYAVNIRKPYVTDDDSLVKFLANSIPSSLT